MVNIHVAQKVSGVTKERMIDVSDVLNGTRVAKTIKTTISQSADLSKITFKGCTNVTVKVWILLKNKPKSHKDLLSNTELSFAG